MNKVILFLVIIIGSFAVGYFLTPSKIETVEKIVYKDKLINQVETVIKYADGTVKIVTQTQTVEVEKEVIKEKTIINQENILITPYVGMYFNQDKFVGAIISKKMFGQIYVGIGAQYAIENKNIAGIISFSINM